MTLKNIKSLKNIYLGLLFVLIFVAIFTPLLVSGDIFVVPEEISEVLIIFLIFIIGYIIYYLYEREIKKQDLALTEAWKHIGEINVQIERFKSAFVDIEKYPESRSDIKYLFALMAQKVMGIVGCSAILYRAIETETGKTLTENFFGPEAKNLELRIGNKELLENNINGGYTIIASSTDNLKIKIFCVFSKIKLSDDQVLFVQKIVNDLANYYIIFTSAYYRNYTK